MFNNVTEAAKHMRNRLKVMGVKARVRADGYWDCIYVISPTFEDVFTDEQRRTILHIASCMGLTATSGRKINVEDVTDPNQIGLFLPAN